MEDVLEWCLGSSDNKSYDSSNEDLLIVSSIKSSQSVNDAQKMDIMMVPFQMYLISVGTGTTGSK